MSMELSENLSVEDLSKNGFNQKRRKINENGDFIDTTLTDNDSKDKRRKQKHSNLLDLPPELLLQFFEYFTFHELATVLRLVCKQFFCIIGDILNKEFWSIKKKIKDRLKKEEIILERYQCLPDSMIKRSCRISKTLEVCYHEYNMLHATFWRYIANSSHLQCFHGGKILDLFNKILNATRSNPRQFCNTGRYKDKSGPKLLKDLDLVVKKFITHFEKEIEPMLEDLQALYGSKLVDIMDVSKYCDKLILKENVIGNCYEYEALYTFRNCWFSVLDLCESATETYDWKEERRLMCLRLRRISHIYTEYWMEMQEWSKEFSLRTDCPYQIKPPTSAQYTGYGEYCGKFFYYGVMNEGAYVLKFLRRSDPELLLQNIRAIEENDFESIYQNDTGPTIFLEIKVQLRCHLSMVPWKTYKLLSKLIDFKKYDCEENAKDNCKLKLAFECSSSKEARLPHKYSYRCYNREKENFTIFHSLIPDNDDENDDDNEIAVDVS